MVRRGASAMNRQRPGVSGTSPELGKGFGVSMVDVEKVFAVIRFISQHSSSEAVPSVSCNISVGEERSMAAKKGALDSSNALLSSTVDQALERYRMAVTNVPVQLDLVESTRSDLRNVMLEAYADRAAEVNALWECGTKIPLSPGAEQPLFLQGNMYQVQSMHEVVPGLFIGSYHPASNKILLQQRGVTHILCCIDVLPRFPNDFKYMTVPAQDAPNYNISIFFEKTYNFIESAIVGQCSSVLVHCGAGISRAPTIAAAYLIRKLRMPADSVIALIQRKRPVASPNAGFRQQLKKYQRDLGVA
ncbi:dual specificity protein phosphatase, putative [Trypanosoma brucei gambiense DAL972]|uniref:Dual specificity protein phosphatase, putative n=3 Tax=Trypanosoma brucei TaxID=5691 RepID=Q586S8_TRYB2|nr:dual specificity protein phosphatase, putative [Trypanosoma brucei gambiense DAL972]XP_951666.1 dual specificity protein phosphatase, putative [Trypanosoma brucei brucei TREU927]AAX80158.1 dual specificity protein phosphatase, putative [Trypanosoma brucei]RHW74098.1 kinetoplastid-specific dual specificity phosphatase [Trypanosoma brucei equiperdum]AAQ15945.1 dual specificity protein phosphatase, putative [Trypanosoma brucei brucei TREU927]CBH09545.1 dual specificity protein phosphatase, put|eukprot:XP_011771850.1 dual specificity protein phosphatase, putative [Trypanosoma brucei gambiense DAL972]